MFAPLWRVVGGKKGWRRVRCRPWSLNPVPPSNMLACRKGSTFDSCKMSTNFLTLKGGEIQTSAFALQWGFSISLVSSNHLQKISPQNRNPLKEQSKSIVHSLPLFGDWQESTIALQSVRCFGTEGRPEILRFRTWVRPSLNKVGHHFPQFLHMTFFILFMNIKFDNSEATHFFVLVSFLPKHHRKMPEIPPSSEAWRCKLVMVVSKPGSLGSWYHLSNSSESGNSGKARNLQILT